MARAWESRRSAGENRLRFDRVVQFTVTSRGYFSSREVVLQPPQVREEPASQRLDNEVVPELGGAVLLDCLGYSTERDRGGAYAYIERYCRDAERARSSPSAWSSWTGYTPASR